MPSQYTIDNTSPVVLCQKHARSVRERITDKDATTSACSVCTLAQRLTYGTTEEFTFTTDHGWTVTRHVDGTVSCTCPAWRFQKRVPPEQRTCKHATVFSSRERTP